MNQSKIEYKFLREGDIAEIHQCMMRSFADYEIDMSYLTLNRFISRARMDRVDFSLSVGAFDGLEMIGYLAVGTDKINNELCAFDAGTGVIADYRGRGVAGTMFDFVLPELKNIGFKFFLLEVLQENKAAIKAYQKSNFKISRSFNCYKFDTQLFKPDAPSLSDVKIKAIDKSTLHQYMHYNEWEVSWEYRLSAIENIKEDLIINGAFVEENCVGFIVYYPTLEWIFMLSVDPQHRKIGIEGVLLDSLINQVKSKTSLVKFNNLPPEHEICALLEKYGFELYTKQYEMICRF